MEAAKLTASDASAIDEFGQSVSVSGDVAVVGAWTSDVDDIPYGSVYVYRYDAGPPGVWIEEAELMASGAALGDEFGVSVAISGNAIVVGAHLDDEAGQDAGAAYVFRFDGLGWHQEAQLTAADAVAYDNFGWSVGIDGDLIVVGANLADPAGVNSGAAYIFRFNGLTWEQEAKVTALDEITNDEFGRSVSISGNAALVGAHYESDGGNQAGSAYLFEFDGVGWAQQAKLTASDATDFDRFGLSVSLSGDRALVGAWHKSNAGGSAAGCAYVFDKPPAGWETMTETAKLVASDAAPGEHFGWAVALAGESAVISAPAHLFDGSGFGSAYVFRLDGGVWTEEAKLMPSDGLQDDQYGYSTTIGDGRVLVGSSRHPTGGYMNAGAAYLYTGIADCNATHVLDACEIADGTSPDADGDGIPDECEGAAIPAAAGWGILTLGTVILLVAAMLFGRARPAGPVT